MIAAADSPASYRLLMDELSSLVSTASAAILTARATALDARTKADLSPVTAADHASEAVLLEGIARLLPGMPIVSEEAVTRSAPSQLSDSFVLVDPLDGTRELLAGRNEFTINVAVMTSEGPWLGIVAAPAQGALWRGIANGGAERLLLPAGAPTSAATERRPLRTRPRPPTGIVAAVSRSHFDPSTAAFMERLPAAERLACGSALKFCRIAEGKADIYPRLSVTCEWDVAAGHALVMAAGGTVLTPGGGPILYGRLDAEFRVPGFIAWGDPSGAAELPGG
jgi:3'(2'), 5'-bisphosphate nucleotidase